MLVYLSISYILSLKSNIQSLNLKNMQRSKILTALKLVPNATIQLHGLELFAWGRDLNFLCDALIPAQDPHPFILSFQDCRDTRWQVYTHQEATIAFPPAELISFAIGRSMHRSPARLLTEYFGLSLFYGDLLVKQGETYTVVGDWRLDFRY